MTQQHNIPPKLDRHFHCWLLRDCLDKEMKGDLEPDTESIYPSQGQVQLLVSCIPLPPAFRHNKIKVNKLKSLRHV